MSAARDRSDFGRLAGRWGDAFWGFILQKRAIGYAYGDNAVWACERLCGFLGDRDMDEEAFAGWAAPRDGEAPTTRGKRILLWNDSARFVRRSGGAAHVADVPVPLESPFTPHVYTEEEARAILRAVDAGIVRRRSRYRPDAIMPAFVRLLYSAGLRFSEAAGLRWEDVDGRRLNVVGKGGRHRLVVISGSMSTVLGRYRDERIGDGGLVFCGEDGRALQNQLVARWQHAALGAAGVRNPDGSWPRLHDWRHTFAVRVLARMDAAGADLRAALPLLSRYMGHCGPRETEWYLRLTEEGRESVLHRMDDYVPGIVPDLGGL